MKDRYQKGVWAQAYQSEQQVRQGMALCVCMHVHMCFFVSVPQKLPHLLTCQVGDYEVYCQLSCIADTHRWLQGGGTRGGRKRKRRRGEEEEEMVEKG